MEEYPRRIKMEYTSDREGCLLMTGCGSIFMLIAGLFGCAGQTMHSNVIRLAAVILIISILLYKNIDDHLIIDTYKRTIFTRRSIFGFKSIDRYADFSRIHAVAAYNLVYSKYRPELGQGTFFIKMILNDGTQLSLGEPHKELDKAEQMAQLLSEITEADYYPCEPSMRIDACKNDEGKHMFLFRREDTTGSDNQS